MNWNLLANQIKTREEFNEWDRLKRYFNQDKPNYLDLIVYHIRYNHPQNTLRYTIINRITRELGASVPPQYATCIARPYKYPDLYKFLKLLKTINESHSVYAYCAATFIYSQAELNKITVGRDKSWFANAPAWLKTILNRQIRLCRNAFLKDDHPFFFIKENDEIKSVTSRHVTNISKLLEAAISLSLRDYIYYYHKFAGLESNGVIFEGSNSDIYTELKQRRRRSLYSAVKVLKLTEKGRITYTHGFCIGEPEPGIYIVDTKEGKLIVPFYLLDVPTIRVSHPPSRAFKALLLLGYIPEEDWPKITSLGKLIKYKVKP